MPIKKEGAPKALRIAFFAHRFPELSETFVINQAAGLVEAGHDLTIFTLTNNVAHAQMHDNVHKYNLMNNVYSLDRKQSKAIRFLKGIPSIFLNPRLAFSVIRQSGPFAISVKLRQLSELGHFRRHEPFDIVHCQFGTAALDVLAEIETGVLRTQKLITHLRGSDITSFVRTHGDDVYKALFEKSDWVFTNSHFFRERAISLGANPLKTSVLYSGADCEKFPYKARSLQQGRTVKLLTVGRLVEKKGIDYAIEAVSRLVTEDYDLTYDIVGDGPLFEHLSSKIKSLGLEKNIMLLGARTHEEIIQLLNKSDIFLAPSVTASNGDQDAPVNTLKEAMLVGLPVIATRHGGIPELVENHISGLLSPERDSTALAENIKLLLSMPEKWSTYGRAGRKKRVERDFNIKNLNRDLINTYTSILNL